MPTQPEYGRTGRAPAVRDDATYLTGTEIRDQRMRWLDKHVITCDDGIRGEWNYTIAPAGDGTGTDDGTAPGPGPDPALLAALAATACHHHAGVSYQILGQLPGTDASTIALTARRLTPLLEPHGITPRYQRARTRTLAQLRDHAATDGITIPDMPATHDTPETAD
jgi:hypothetical protein